MAHGGFRDFSGVRIDNSQGNVVMGDNNGPVTNNVAPASGDGLELQRRIDELQRLLTEYATQLPDPGQLRDLTDELSNQLQGRQPNRTVVRSLLTSLAAGAGGVNAVLAAVNGIGQLVSRLLT